MSQKETGEPIQPLEANDQRITRFVVCGNLFEARCARGCGRMRTKLSRTTHARSPRAQLPSHYQPLKPIGKGAYGVVCSAVDSRTGERVAVKRISGAFDNSVDAKRTLREIMLLRQLRHENVIAIKARTQRLRASEAAEHVLTHRTRTHIGRDAPTGAASVHGPVCGVRAC